LAPSPRAWPGCAPSTGRGSSTAGWPGAVPFSADERFYFVHSYGVRNFPLAAEGRPSPLPRPLVTWAEHGDRFVAGVENTALSATQFHPEKSGDAGAQLLTNWLRTLD
jgi:glutamine amidotransferase